MLPASIAHFVLFHRAEEPFCLVFAERRKKTSSVRRCRAKERFGDAGFAAPSWVCQIVNRGRPLRRGNEPGIDDQNPARAAKPCHVPSGDFAHVGNVLAAGERYGSSKPAGQPNGIENLVIPENVTPRPLALGKDGLRQANRFCGLSVELTEHADAGCLFEIREDRLGKSFVQCSVNHDFPIGAPSATAKSKPHEAKEYPGPSVTIVGRLHDRVRILRVQAASLPRPIYHLLRMRLIAKHLSIALVAPLSMVAGCSHADAPAAKQPPQTTVASDHAHRELPASQPQPRSRTLADLMTEGATDSPTTTPAANLLPQDHPKNTKKSSAAESNVPQGPASPLEPAIDDRAQHFQRPLHEIDEARAAAAGIRKLAGAHLLLFTDLAVDPVVDELPAVFDAAFPAWCKELGLDPQGQAAWQMRGFLVKDREHFVASGLWPADLPQFLNGYTRGREFWLYNQSSDYYRRHLMLHEGVHGIMFSLQRSSGPAWYMEGIAELLATHRWSEGKLTVPYFPQAAAEVPKLGRIEIVQLQFKQKKAKHFRDILALSNRSYLENEPYAWSWAAAAFLYNHPAYRDRFRALMKQPASSDFNERLKASYVSDGRALSEEWQVFVSELSHGYDFERMRLDLADAKTSPQPAAPATVAIAADRGWQSTGLLLEAGKQYRLTASGQYQIGADRKPWISEANGVTIRYHRGLPLGILLAAVRPTERDSAISPFFEPQVIGLSGTIMPQQAGTLYLRINDFAGELADNQGSAKVVVTTE